MFYRVVWYEGSSSTATVTTNMIYYADETVEMLVTNELHGLTIGTDTYAGALVHTPIVPGSVFISAGSTIFFDNGMGTLTGGNGGNINYGTGAWNVRFVGYPNPGYPISITYLYMATVPVLVPEVTVAGGNLGTSVSAADNYAGVLENVTVQPGSLTIFMGSLVFYDTGTGLLVATGGSSGTINYETGLWRLSIAGTISPGLLITASYRAVEYPPDEDTAITSEVTVMGEYQGLTDSWDRYYGALFHRPVVAGSVTITANGYIFNDNGSGLLLGHGGGTINYATGVWSANFNFSPTGYIPILASYQYYDETIIPVTPIRILNEPAGQGIAGCTVYAGKLAHIPDFGSLSIVAGGYGFEEGAEGALLSPHGTGTIFHGSGVWIISFTDAVLGEGTPIKASYKYRP
jgi:hypothetical protein